MHVILITQVLLSIIKPAEYGMSIFFRMIDGRNQIKQNAAGFRQGVGQEIVGIFDMMLFLLGTHGLARFHSWRCLEPRVSITGRHAARR
jgi:hypothetical protein